MATRWMVTTPAGIAGLFKTEAAATKWFENGAKASLTRKTKAGGETSAPQIITDATPVLIIEIEFDE